MSRRKNALLVALPLTVIALLAVSWAMLNDRAAALPQSATAPVVEYQQMVEGWTFQLALECDPDSGYWWKVAAINPAITRLLKQEFIAADDGADAAGQQVLDFYAAAPGHTVIRLYYVRPGEDDLQAQRCYEFHIQVVPHNVG